MNRTLVIVLSTWHEAPFPPVTHTEHSHTATLHITANMPSYFHPQPLDAQGPTLTHRSATKTASFITGNH